MNPHSQRPLPPVFSSEQEQNKAECAAIWYTYAVEAEQKDDLLGARMGFTCAWKEQPEELKYFQVLVNFLDRNGYIDELFKVYDIGVQLFKNHLATCVNYSCLLNEYGFYERGKETAEMALMMDSHSLAGWGNLGNAFRGLGDYDRAISCFQKVLKHEPDHPHAGFNLASVLLSIGDFEKGFVLYDHRLNLPGYERLVKRNGAPVWTNEDFKNCSVLVYAEQGLGDTLMFVRYLPLLLQTGAKQVIFEVQKPLDWIISEIETEQIKVVVRDNLDSALTIETDYQIPLLSLPKVALQQRSSLKTEVPYLQVPEINAPRAAEKMRGIGENQRLRIGLCWQGNPHAAVDAGRSLDLSSFQPLFSRQDADFVSLQARDGLDEVEGIAKRFENFHFLSDLDHDTRAFEETLELMKDLDLVITTDTAVAHLAGALGKPCWLLLQKCPEWRWGTTGETCRWYPQMRLFRQEESGVWDTVVSSLCLALDEVLLDEGKTLSAVGCAEK